MVPTQLLTGWGMLILSVVFNAYSIFLIKRRLNELGEIKLESFGFLFNYGLEFLKSPGALIGLVLFVAAPFFLAVAVSRMELTIAYPVQVGLNFVMVIALSVFYLGESLTVEKGIGIGLVLGSIYFLSK